MRALATTCLALLVTQSVAYSAARAPRPRSATELYRAARRECGHPGPVLEQFVERYDTSGITAKLLGEHLVTDWRKLSDEQRHQFEERATPGLLRHAREKILQDVIGSVCSRNDRYDHETLDEDAGNKRSKVWVKHRWVDESHSFAWVFELDDHGWYLVDELPTWYVSSEEYHRRVVYGPLRQELGTEDYAQVLAALVRFSK
jgi:hypothetical protein